MRYEVNAVMTQRAKNTRQPQLLAISACLAKLGWKFWGWGAAVGGGGGGSRRAAEEAAEEAAARGQQAEEHNLIKLGASSSTFHCNGRVGGKPPRQQPQPESRRAQIHQAGSKLKHISLQWTPHQTRQDSRTAARGQ